MPLSPLRHLGTVEEKDHHNKVGVLTMLAQGQPHTTVLAFLSSLQDDVFLISMPGTFKSQVLKREPRCFFTIDERAKFTFELSRYGKVGLASEEIFDIVYLPFIVAWNIIKVECSYLKHRSCTFCIRSSYNRSMEIEKSIIIEIFMNGISHMVTYTEYCTESICTRA